MDMEMARFLSKEGRELPVGCDETVEGEGGPRFKFFVFFCSLEGMRHSSE